MGEKMIFIDPGEIKSLTDGQIHYIGASDLMRLCGINAEIRKKYRVIIMKPHGDPERARQVDFRKRNHRYAVRIHPKANGMYDDVRDMLKALI